METPINERLRALLKSKQIRNKDLADMLGVTPNSITNWVRGTNRMSVENARRICEIYPDVSFDWLMTGEGDMIKWGQDPTPEYCRKCIEKDVRISMLQDTISRMEFKVDQLNREIGRLNKESLSETNGQAKLKKNG